MVTNQETVQGQLNRYISDLTTEKNLDSDEGQNHWASWNLGYGKYYLLEI